MIAGIHTPQEYIVWLDRWRTTSAVVQLHALATLGLWPREMQELQRLFPDGVIDGRSKGSKGEVFNAV